VSGFRKTVERFPRNASHGEAEADRLRAELEELTGKPVQLHVVREEGPGDTGTGRAG
jgi:hypothetical protein